MTEPPPSPTTPAARMRGLAALERLVGLADAVIGSVRFVMFACLAAGLWCWVAIFAPFSFSVFSGTLALVVLLVTILPGAVMVLLYLGLQQVRKAPFRIDELRRQGITGVQGLMNSVRVNPEVERRRGVWKVLRALWEFRSLADEARELALQYWAIVRLANPVTAIAVAIALGASGGLAIIAGVVSLFRLF